MFGAGNLWAGPGVTIHDPRGHDGDDAVAGRGGAGAGRGARGVRGEMSADVMMQRDMKSDAGGTMPQKGGVESGKPTMEKDPMMEKKR
jgi:hypothetical protein